FHIYIILYLETPFVKIRFAVQYAGYAFLVHECKAWPYTANGRFKFRVLYKLIAWLVRYACFEQHGIMYLPQHTCQRCGCVVRPLFRIIIGPCVKSSIAY